MTAPRLKSEVGPVEPAESVFYPIEDDEPLAESEYQLFPLVYAYGALTAWFSDDPTTWVGSDMFLYYEEGDPSKVVAPDLFVVTQTHKEERRNTFQTWVEGRIPDFILEVLSESNYRNDLVTKFPIYRQLGVKEYWMYDPTPTGILSPPLQGHRLVGGEYQPIPVEETEQPGRYRGVSEVLRLELHAERDWFRLFDPVEGIYRRDIQESEQALAAEREARLAEQQALAAEREARLADQEALITERAARAELERLLREHGIEPPV